MNREISIDRPIFIVGCGRSGTTILYELLSGHPDLAWFSTYSQRWPQLPLAIAPSKLHDLGQLSRKYRDKLPRPVEGYPLWDYCKPVANSPSDPPLTESDARPDDIARVRDMVATHLRYQGKPRFINKNTRNTRRIRYLDAIFKDALFVHIVRNPRATVNSLLKVDFWPDLKIWSERQVTPRQWEAAGNDSAVLAARLWSAEVQRALDDSAMLPDHRYVQLRYEDLMEHPEDILAGILAFCGLEWSERFSRFVASFRLANMNSKYDSQLSAERIARIDRVVAPVARRLGYQLDSTQRRRRRTSAAIIAASMRRDIEFDSTIVGRTA